MSATARSDVRRKDDFYETQAWCVDLLLDRISIPKTSHVCEPCAGQGAIVRRVLIHGFTSVECFELDRGRSRCLFDLPVSVQVGDARRLQPYRTPSLTISNPPYILAQAIIEAALAYTRGIVAMLLRLDFVAPKNRRPLFTSHGLPWLGVFERRPSFVSNVSWILVDRDNEKVDGPFDNKGAAEAAACLSGRTDLRLKRRTVNNDSCEYAWAVWGLPGGDGRWERLHNGA